MTSDFKVYVKAHPEIFSIGIKTNLEEFFKISQRSLFLNHECINKCISSAFNFLKAAFLELKSQKDTHLVVQINEVNELSIIFGFDSLRAVKLTSAKVNIAIGRAFPHLMSTWDMNSFRNDLDKMENTAPNFIKRIPLITREKLLKRVAERPPISSGDLLAFKLGEWSHDAFKKSDWHLDVLKSFLEGAMDDLEAAKLLLYDQCFQESYSDSPRTFQVFEADGTLNREAAEMLNQGLGKYLKPEEKRQLLYSILANLPPHAGQFFAIKIPRINEVVSEVLEEEYVPTNVMQVVFHTAKFNLLIIPKPGEVWTKLILPPAFLEIILKVKFGENAIKTRPGIGLFKIEKLSDAERRPVFIPCRGIVHPYSVHNYSASPLQIYHHDGYHTWVESANVHRKAWIELALLCYQLEEIFLESSTTSKPIGKEPLLVCKELREKVQELTFDREFPFYYNEQSQLRLLEKLLINDAEKFWYSLGKLTIRFQKRTKDESYRSMIILFLKHIAAHEERWNRDYGLNLNSLNVAWNREPNALSRQVLLPIFTYFEHQKNVVDRIRMANPFPEIILNLIAAF